MTLPRLNPINLMASGNYSIYSKVNPLYGGKDPISLQEVLSKANLAYPITSTQLGLSNDGEYITLEAFLIEASLPLVSTKTISITLFRDEPILLTTTYLRVSNDVLSMNVLSSNRDCRFINNQLYTRTPLAIGMTEYPVSSITYIELGEGLWWRH